MKSAEKLGQEAYACTQCLISPGYLKVLRDTNQKAFLQDVSICADYVGTMSTRQQKLYSYWISTDIKCELERLSGMPYDEYEAVMQDMFDEFYGFSYRMLQRTVNCRVKTLNNIEQLTKAKSTRELTANSIHTEHFFGVVRHLLDISGDTPISVKQVGVQAG